MAKFWVNPVVVEAEQWFPGNQVDGVIGDQFDTPGTPESMRYHLKGSDGRVSVCPGDWIITDADGVRSVCKPDVFTRAYRPVV